MTYQSRRGSGRAMRGIGHFIDLKQIPYEFPEEKKGDKEEKKEDTKIEKPKQYERKIPEERPKEARSSEKKLENYSVETFIIKVNGNPDEAADFLLNNKRKMEQAEMVEQFVAAFKKSSKDIAQQALDLLIAFNTNNVKAYISINLVKSLSNIRFSKENFTNLLNDNWKLVDPQALIHLTRGKFIEIPIEEAASHLFAI
mmetsp:Transcript_25611/g.25184  ORF Transcript_25611/g.25184 Transcript_25611/m.25184 type:complete len:199 (-) Transcript_25611:1260-1856(-)